MVIARSRWSWTSPTASGMVSAMNLVAAVAGTAPVVGPLLGALVLSVSHWRVSFWAVAALAAVVLGAVARAMPESLPVERHQHRRPRRSPSARPVRCCVLARVQRARGSAGVPRIGHRVRLRGHLRVRAAIDQRPGTIVDVGQLRGQRRRHDSPSQLVAAQVRAPGAEARVFVDSVLPVHPLSTALVMDIDFFWFSIPIRRRIGGLFRAHDGPGTRRPQRSCARLHPQSRDRSPAPGSPASFGFLQWLMASTHPRPSPAPRPRAGHRRPRGRHHPHITVATRRRLPPATGAPPTDDAETQLPTPGVGNHP